MIIILFSLIILNLIIYIKLDKIANFINIFDTPNNKLKKHRNKTPLLGGIIIFLNFIFILTFNYDFIKFHTSIKLNFSLIFFVLSFFLVGLVDDKYYLKPEKKIILSILFSIIVLSLNNNLLITNLQFSFYNNIYLGDFSYFFTIFCIIILINALNFYDGINGQAILFFFVVFSYLAYKSSIGELYFVILLLLAILLILNLKEKLFLGDSGIYLLGTILTIFLIYEYNYFKSIIFVEEIFFLLILPGYDLLRLTTTRIYKGKNAFYGDRNHIHHLLINKFSLIKTNVILILLMILPIFLYSFLGIDFFIVLSIITIIYISIILKIKL